MNNEGSMKSYVNVKQTVLREMLELYEASIQGYRQVRVQS